MTSTDPDPRDLQAPPGVPRWVKVVAVAIAVLVLALVVSALLGLDHGPGMH